MATSRRLKALVLLATVGGGACSASGGGNRPLDSAAPPAVDAGTDSATRDTGGRQPDSGHAPKGDASAPVDAGRDVALRVDARSDGPVDAGPSDAAIDRAVDARAAAEAATDGGATSISLSLPTFPAFSTSTFDYYVQCTAPSPDAITVTMTAAPGSTIGLLQPIVTPPSSGSVSPVSVALDAAIVVGVATDAVTTQYWFRCIEPNFPLVSPTFYPDAGTPTPGYYIVGSVVSGEGRSGVAMILDGHGVPVWYESMGASRAAYDVENLTPGTLSLAPVLPEPSMADPTTFALQDLPTGTMAAVAASGAPADFHELRALPNGDYLLFTSPIIEGVNLSGLGFGTSVNMLGCVIQEISPSGSLVWTWDITDHFDPNEDSTYPTMGLSADGDVADTFHCNSIDVATDGDLLVSARNMDSVFLITRASGVVAWKMGGATYSKDNAPYIKVTDDPLTQFYREHDVRFQPDGTISMFDDQTQKAGPARAVIYSYDVTTAKAKMVWQYQGTQTSADMGSFRISEDGSRVIGWGAGPSTRDFSEVTEGGADLADFVFADGNLTYRAIKVPTTAFDINVLRKSAGGTL